MTDRRSSLRPDRLRIALEALEDRCVPASFLVGTLEFPTIQDAVDAAALNPGDDVVLVPPGRYEENVRIDDSSGSLTVRGTTGNPADVVVDGMGRDEVFRAVLTNDVTIEGLTATNGGRNPNVEFSGRGIYAFGPGDLTVRSVRALDNLDGGVVASNRFFGSTGGQVTVSDSVFEGNKDGLFVRDFAGVTLERVVSERNVLHGIYAEQAGRITAIDSRFSSNPDNGIDVRNSGEVALTRVTVADNGPGQQISGIYLGGVGDVTLTNTALARNGWTGLEVGSAKGAVVLNGVEAVDNTVRGAQLNQVAGGVTVNGGTFARNGRGGLHVDNSGGANISGGVFADNGTATTPLFGGGIYVSAPAGVVTPVHISGVTVTGNRAAQSGAGIRILVASDPNSPVRITDSLVAGNRTTGSQATGGGIALPQTATVTEIRGVRVVGNSAAVGGGGISSAGRLTVTESTVADNEALRGAGIDQSGQLTVERSTLSGNRASGLGGGISNAGGTVFLTNVTISGNKAVNEGGGLLDRSGTVRVVHSTIAFNEAPSGGGLSTLGGTLTVGGTIISGNTPNPFTGEVSGFVTSLGYNLVGAVTPNAGFFAVGDQAGSVGAPIDAGLEPLADNGGPTFTHALTPGSRAVDANDPALTLTVDQRGLPRPVDGDGDGTARADVGAYELQAAPVADAGGPYQVTEGGFVTLDAAESRSFQADPTLTYDWDFDGDGRFDDATGVAPVFPATALDGPSEVTVGLRVTDSAGRTAESSAIINVLNADPVITELRVLSFPAAGVPVSIRGLFTDPGVLDTHTARVSWGDGTVSAGDVARQGTDGRVEAEHTYAMPGVYTITLTVTDDDGGMASEAVEVRVAGVSLSDGVLRIFGTDGDDAIDVRGKGKTIEVSTAGERGGVVSFDASAVRVILARLNGGDDFLRVHPNVKVPAILIGGDGSDVLIGGGGPNVLIGGAGSDRLSGSGQDDLLIGGVTLYDQDDDALLMIMDEWGSNRSYEQRVANLRGGTGQVLGGTGIRLVYGTVLDDQAPDALTGGGGLDWFFDDDGDTTDRKRNELSR